MSNNTNDDFRQKLKNFAEDVQKQASHCSNEEATKQFLILPFFELLGYNSRDPREFKPEYVADPSGKDRVDYVILRNEKPIIALECKPNHCSHKDFVTGRGQLKAYFQSEVTIKMGILTNGVIYEFYADSDHLNMMDSEAFLTLNLNDIVQGQQIEKSELEMLQSFQKLTFNPEELRDEAKKMRSLQNFVKQIKELLDEPSDEFVRLLVQKQALTQQTPTEEDKKLVKKAFDVFLKEQLQTQLAESEEESSERTVVCDETNPILVNKSIVHHGVIVKSSSGSVASYKSVPSAFKILELPWKDHKPFRYGVRSNGSDVYTRENGEELHFALIEKSALEYLVTQGFCPAGTPVFSQDHCYKATVTAQGMLQTPDGKIGAPSVLSEMLLKVKNSNGWDFWHVNYEGQEISLSELRAIAAESLKKI